MEATQPENQADALKQLDQIFRLIAEIFEEEKLYGVVGLLREVATLETDIKNLKKEKLNRVEKIANFGT